jgi:hypothetical protein
MPGVAVASEVVMISKRPGSTEVAVGGAGASAIEAHPMRWYSISGMSRIQPEDTVAVTNGSRADVQGQGQGHLAREGIGGAAVEAETRDGGGGPQTATETGFVAGGANFLSSSEFRCNQDDCFDRSF